MCVCLLQHLAPRDDSIAGQAARRRTNRDPEFSWGLSLVRLAYGSNTRAMPSVAAKGFFGYRCAEAR
jgi:hypothetical protein